MGKLEGGKDPAMTLKSERGKEERDNHDWVLTVGEKFPLNIKLFLKLSS